MTEHTNWGRWGAEDERGMLNVIDASTRRTAAACVRTGAMYSLAHDLDETAPRTPSRQAPWHTIRASHHRSQPRGSIDDVLTLNSHMGTHLDALCHSWSADGLYNGFDPAEISSDGAPRLGVHNVDGIATRGVLIDVSSSCPRGRDGWGHEISCDDVQAKLGEAGLTIGAGDAVLLHTGWSRELQDDPGVYAWGEPGIGLELAEWLAQRDVVLVGADNWAVEAVPPSTRGNGLVVHQALLNRYGIYLAENLVLGPVAEAQGTCEGLLVIAPIRIRQGAGSPINPIFLC